MYARGATNPANVDLRDGTRMSLNEYLGSLLREYIALLVEALHNGLIANSTFPLLTARSGDGGVLIKSRIRQRLQDSHTLQAQMRIFKGTWESNKALLPALRCYAKGPAQWVDKGIAANEMAIVQATSKIEEFHIRARPGVQNI